MGERQRRAEQALPVLTALADEVLTLSDCIGSAQVAIGDVGHSAKERAGLMTVSYVGKQDEHLRSIRVLIHAGQHRDAFLIARTMIEGLAQVLWAHKHQPHGPDEWFWYEAVEDWRQLQINKSDGLIVDAEIVAIAQQLLDQYGSNYYTSKAVEKVNAGEPLPADPYRRKWSRMDAASIFYHVQGEELYRVVYRVASDWVHWSPRSMRLPFANEGSVEKYVIGDASRAAQALAAGGLSLLQTLDIVNTHFQLGAENQLSAIFTRFSNALELVELEDTSGKVM